MVKKIKAEIPIAEYFAKHRKRRAKLRSRIADNKKLADLSGVNKAALLPSHKDLEAALDKAFSRFIVRRGFWRNGGLCEICLKKSANQPFHWLSRTFKGVRWHPWNAVASCSGCNKHEKDTRGTKQYRYTKMFTARYGSKRMEILTGIDETHPKWDRSEMFDLLKRIKAVLVGARDQEYVIREDTMTPFNSWETANVQQHEHAQKNQAQDDGKREHHRDQDRGIQGSTAEVVRKESGTAREQCGLPGTDGCASQGTLRSAGEKRSELADSREG